MRNQRDIVFEQLSSGRYVMRRNRFGSLHGGIKEESEVMLYVNQGMKVEVIRPNGEIDVLSNS